MHGRRGFTMMELIIGLGMVGLLFPLFYASMRGVHDAGRAYTEEAQAVIVLENVVERSRGVAALSPARLEALLGEEFARSGLASGGRLRAQCRGGADGVCVGIVRKSGVVLTEFKVPR